MTYYLLRALITCNQQSANGIDDGAGGIINYMLNGQYLIASVTAKQIKLSNPSATNTEWQKPVDNTDFTVQSSTVTISKESIALWQGWFYTDLKDHDSAYVNIAAPNGLYDSESSGRWKGLRIFGEIEKEIVDVNNKPLVSNLLMLGAVFQAVGKKS